MTDVRVFGSDGLDATIAVLRRRGYDVFGPTLRDDVVTYGPIESVADLPVGRGDEQSPARYRSRARGDGALFGYAAPVQSAKAQFLPSDELLWTSRPGDAASGPVIERQAAERRPVAFVGLRSCDLAAVLQQDRILTQRAHADVAYAGRRAGAFLIAVTCSDPADTCFCASLGTGPSPGEGADVSLTEIVGDGPHRFVATPGSPRGTELLDAVGAGPASDEDVAAAHRVERRAVTRMGRELRTDDLVGVLYASTESPHWDAVAERCLACTNCTLVCPTCFCTTITDAGDLTGGAAERRRVWASCFTKDYSYIHGGSVRTSTQARYRQWITHKLATWQVQFGSVGCVGCGRCITWCPAGIDLTAEVATLRAGDTALKSSRAAGPRPSPRED
nr:sulfite reductase subunit A [Propionibacterium sp.]